MFLVKTALECWRRSIQTCESALKSKCVFTALCGGLNDPSEQLVNVLNDVKANCLKELKKNDARLRKGVTRILEKLAKEMKKLEEFKGLRQTFCCDLIFL